MSYDGWLTAPYEARARAEALYEKASEALIDEGAECDHISRNRIKDCSVCLDEDGLEKDGVLYEHMHDEHGGCERCEENLVERWAEDAAEAAAERAAEARAEGW